MEMQARQRALDKIYKRRDRYDIPDWQRQKVWNTKTKRRLIDTILRGWKLPKFYFQKISDDPEEFEVVDGQQRLATIWEFMDGDLKLDQKQAAYFSGDTYQTLPENLSDAFDDYEIDYDEITHASDEELKEFFQRLQEALPLTSSEKLNAIHSSLRDFCVDIAQHPFFSNTTVIADKRYAYFDISAKVATIEIEGPDVGLRFDDVRHVFESNSAFSRQSAAANRIQESMDYLNSSFPSPCSFFRNRTIVQSIVSLVCHLKKSGLHDACASVFPIFVEEFLSELRQQVEAGHGATNNDYVRFQRTVNANVKSGANTRQNILLRQLFLKHPCVISLAAQSSDILQGVNEDRKTLAQEVKELIYIINQTHAARHGDDLFKVTNKTLSSVSALNGEVKTPVEFKNFIENLYFIFWEGPGDRLGDRPEVFEHIKAMRTAFEHDLDHGDPRKAIKKKKRIGDIFYSYAGIHSVESLDPGSFSFAQVNILTSVKATLINISKSLR